MNQKRNKYAILLRFLITSLVVGFLVSAFVSVSKYRKWVHLAEIPPFVMPSSTTAWRVDLRYLAAEIPKRHKNAFHTVTRAQFDRAVAELDSAIPTLNNDQIVVGLMRITAMSPDSRLSTSAY